MPGRWSPRRLDKTADASRIRNLSARVAAACLAAALLAGCGESDKKSSPTTTSIRRFTIVTPNPRLVGIDSNQATVPKTYVVQPGDTLSLIAFRFRVSEDELLTLNHLSDPDSLYSGQQLLIPQTNN